MADEPEPRDTPPAPVPEPAPPAPELAVETKPLKPTWQEVELGQTRRQLEEIREQNRRLQELAQAQSQPASPPPPLAPPPPSIPEPRPALPQQQPEFRRAVDEEVALRIQDEKAKELDLALKRDFPEDYQVICNNFANIQDSIKVLFGGIMACDNPAYVAATIGRDPSHIQQLRALPEARRLAELIKIDLGKPKPTADVPATPVTRVSSAPPPPTMAPVGGSPQAPTGYVNLYDERFEFSKYYNGDLGLEQERDATWYAERGRQKRERALANRER
jgi:hypothetical protein